MDAPTKPKLPDAYTDLEVSPAATSAEIKAAFHRLALLHHPDKKAPGETFDAEDFRRIQEAYDLLRDEEEKRRYDQCYSSVRHQWDVYTRECAEYSQDPTAWRRRKAESARAQAEAYRYAAEEEESDEEDYYSFFGGFGYDRRPRDPALSDLWELQERILAEMRRRSAMYDAAAECFAEERTRKVAIEDINKRCIERQKKAAEAQQAKDDGILIVDSEKKRDMAQSWVLSLQRDYRQELQNAELQLPTDSVMDIGWERKKGRQTCLFCEAHVQEYSYRCPSGGAVACRSCKKEIESSSSSKPFNFHYDESSAKKGKSKKGKGGKKSKKTKIKPEHESDLEDSGFGEQEHDEEQGHGEETECLLNEEEEAAKQAAEEAARKQDAERQEQERKAREVREKAKREAQAKLAQEAAKKVAKEKAEAEQVARDQEAAREAARQAAQKKKEAREQDAKEKKAARKKAAKERVTLEKAAQKKAAEEREAAQREVQKNDGAEQKVQNAHDDSETEAKHNPEKDVKAKTGQDAGQRLARETEGHAIQESEDRETEDIEKRAEYTDRVAEEREIGTIAAEAKQRVELEAKEAAEREDKGMAEHVLEETAEHVPKETVERQVPGPTETDNGPGHEVEDEKTGNGKQQVVEPPATTTPFAELSIPDSTATHKKAKKKATRPPPTCHVCNEEGHIARKCPVKDVKATEVNGSQPQTATEPALGVEVTSKPPPPQLASPAKIVVKLPTPRMQKIEEAAEDFTVTSQESATHLANASAPRKPTKPSRAPKKKAPRSTPQKDQAVDSVAKPTPSFITSAQMDGTADVPVLTQTSKPVKKPKAKRPSMCFVCKEAGHKVKSCPTKKDKEPMFETVR
ncbi:hypothetical protein ACET3X_005084 [Alternaria dauci]|uniref:J domain-containing protein n=1 Tax=Alternaria dauci TaxID=48095 RepID=A0ABR3UL29_9PLEO